MHCPVHGHHHDNLDYSNHWDQLGHKAYGLVCQQWRQDVYPIYALIAANQATLPARTMCKTLKVSASGFYGWLERPMCQRHQANVALTAQIREAFVASDETYGMPRIRAELRDAGVVASGKRIARLMRQAQLRGVSRRRSFCVHALYVEAHGAT